eukprot:9955519-Ditylum_brightwellii.AAC.1
MAKQGKLSVRVDVLTNEESEVTVSEQMKSHRETALDMEERHKAQEVSDTNTDADTDDNDPAVNEAVDPDPPVV